VTTLPKTRGSASTVLLDGFFWRLNREVTRPLNHTLLAIKTLRIPLLYKAGRTSVIAW